MAPWTTTATSCTLMSWPDWRSTNASNFISRRPALLGWSSGGPAIAIRRIGRAVSAAFSNSSKPSRNISSTTVRTRFPFLWTKGGASSDGRLGAGGPTPNSRLCRPATSCLAAVQTAARRSAGRSRSGGPGRGLPRLWGARHCCRCGGRHRHLRPRVQPASEKKGRSETSGVASTASTQRLSGRKGAVRAGRADPPLLPARALSSLPLVGRLPMEPCPVPWPRCAFSSSPASQEPQIHWWWRPIATSASTGRLTRSAS